MPPTFGYIRTCVMYIQYAQHMQYILYVHMYVHTYSMCCTDTCMHARLNPVLSFQSYMPKGTGYWDEEPTKPRSSLPMIKAALEFMKKDSFEVLICSGTSVI